GLAFSGASDHNLKPLLVGFFLVSLLSATQDIATDALSLDLLRTDERGRGGAIQAGAYRAGMIAGGGGILAMIDFIGIREAFLLMAALVALTTLPLYGLQEARVTPAVQGTQSLKLLGSYFTRRDAWSTIGLLFAFKIGDALAAGMVTRWFVKQGLSTATIAMSRGTLGGVAAVVGALFGGFLMRALGARRALVALALAQGLAIAVYVLLDRVHPIGIGPMALWVYYAASGVEHFFGGAATAALFAHMMESCRDEARGTDFTVQACALVMITGLGLLASGFVVKALGLTGLFWVAGALGLLAPAVVGLLLRGRDLRPSAP
ncbi:MAG: MFS transporter, partial [Myxococcales bacterium]|nr:MFS transporter [Myxococcales bacterium]